MLETDPLSLIFIGCALFSTLFLVATLALSSGHSHGHAGHGHTGHGHTGHGHAGHGHTGHGHAGHGHVAGAHTAHTPGHQAAGHASHAARGGRIAHSAPNAGQQAGVPANSADLSVGHLWTTTQGLIFGALNLNGLLIFLLVFGVLGYLLHTNRSMPSLVALTIAALVGALGAIAVNAALARIFFDNEAGELTARSSQIEGRIATVSVAIRPGGIGEIIYTGDLGARQSMGAYASDSTTGIPAGTEVVIVDSDRGIATVQPWSLLLEETKARLAGRSDQIISPPNA